MMSFQHLINLNVLLFILPFVSYSDGQSGIPPNIIFILTDDQDVELGSLEPMVKANKLIGDAGIHFKNTFTTSSLCCPSRSSILTGNYVHNNGAVNNSVSGNCSSPAWQRTAEKLTFVTELSQRGYKTFFAGKYLNQYGMEATGGVKHIPPGWDHWNGLVGNSVYYNYELSVNGQSEKHGDNYTTDYLTNIIAKRANTFLKDHVGDTKREKKQQPFFMMLSTPACHAPFTPAPQHANAFNNVRAPRNGSFNVYDQNKHWLVRQAKHPLSAQTTEMIDDVYRNRWRTLLSVDDMVEEIITTLNVTSLLDNTYVIFTSDNGYHLGQFSLPIDKRQMYEFDIRIPLMVRGPNIKPGQVLQDIILNIDFAPTFMDIAGVEHPPFTVDGHSFRSLLHPGGKKQGTSGASDKIVPQGNDIEHGIKKQDAPGGEGGVDGVEEGVAWRNDFLVEHTGEYTENVPNCPGLSHQNVSQCFPDCVCEDSLNNTYACVRTISDKFNVMYCEFNDHENFVEVYNLAKDPYQLTNIARQIDPKVLVDMNKRLLKLSICTGKACHLIEES